MLLDILAVIAPIFFCAALGFFWSHYQQAYNAEFVSRLVMNVGCPCLILSTLTQAEIPLGINLFMNNVHRQWTTDGQD